MKKVICFTLVWLMAMLWVHPLFVTTCSASAAADEIQTEQNFSAGVNGNMFFYVKSPRVRIGDSIMQIDAENPAVTPVLQNGAAMLPADFLAVALKLTYSGDAHTGEITDGSKAMRITEGEAACTVNGETIGLLAAPFASYGHLYVSAEDVCRVFAMAFMQDESGIAVIGETADSFNWNDKDDFACLNAALRDVIYETPTAADVIELLKKKNAGQRHPRLMLDENKAAVLREKVASEEPYKSWMAGVIEEAERYLTAELPEYVLEDGGLRLLYTSRKALLYIENMAFAYQMTGDTRYARGAVEVMLRVCDDAYFPDWHPYHFLDTAEMAAAVAIGYDWCYRAMSAEEKEIVRRAIVEKALKPVMEDYNEVSGRKRTWYWSSKSSQAYPQNWVAVCFGGTAMAALAIGDEDLTAYDFTEVGRVITEGMERVKDWQETYMPDGACTDGTGYWEFAMSYMVFGFDSMATALGTDYGMMSSPGMERTFTWLSQMMGPAGAFNYDSNSSAFVNSPEFFWYGAKMNRPELTACRLQQQIDEQKAQITYKDILWYESGDERSAEAAYDFATRGNVGMTVMRSGNHREDTWLTLFGGYMNKAADTTQDFDGSFVVDMLGKRWALDLGAEWQTYVDLSTPKHHYYRARAEGHNTVIIEPGEGRDHDPGAFGRQQQFASNHLSAFTVYDFTGELAYKGASSWRRGAFLDRETGAVLIQDELLAEKEIEYYWFMHTEAAITLSEDGKTAILTQGDRQIAARLISEDDSLTFSVMEAAPLATSPHPDTQSDNSGVQKLAVYKTGTSAVYMAVQLVPMADGAPVCEAKAYTALADWQLKTDSDYTKPTEEPTRTNVFLNKKITVNIPSRPQLRDYMIVDGSYDNYQGSVLDRYASSGKVTKPLEITIDLGGLYLLDTVMPVERWLKAYNTNRGGVGCYDSVKIETGITSYGVTKYVTAKEIFGDAIAKGTRDNEAAVTHIDLGGVAADTVKITLDVKNQDLGYVQYEIWEILGMGQPIEKSKVLAVDKVTFSQNGVTAETPPQNGSFCARVYHNAVTPAVVLVALLDAQGRIIDCQSGRTETDIWFTVPSDKAVSAVQVFTWQSADSLRPLAPSERITQQP